MIFLPSRANEMRAPTSCLHKYKKPSLESAFLHPTARLDSTNSEESEANKSMKNAELSVSIPDTPENKTGGEHQKDIIVEGTEKMVNCQDDDTAIVVEIGQKSDDEKQKIQMDDISTISLESSERKLPFDKNISADILSSTYTTKELKSFAKDLGISVSGKKIEMAQSLLERM